MTKLKCIIIDDEPLAREGVELNCNELPYVEIVGQFGNAITASTFLQENQVDIIFLDIQMPGLTGIEFLKTINCTAQVILTTAYPQYALEAFELDVIDYLVKPIRMNRFLKAVTKAKQVIDLQQSSEQLKVDGINEEFIYLKADRKFHRVFFNEVKYIKGMKDYVMIYLEGKQLMTAMNVSTMHSQLPDSIFARVSKSYLINVNFIDNIDVDSISLKGEEIPLGRTYKESFIEKYVKGNLIGKKKN